MTLIFALPFRTVTEQVLRVSAASSGNWVWSRSSLSRSLMVAAMSAKASFHSGGAAGASPLK